MSSLVALIISSWILSIVVVEMCWSRLSLYFCLTSSRSCLTLREMSWSSWFVQSSLEEAVSLILERGLRMSSSLESRLITFWSILESSFAMVLSRESTLETTDATLSQSSNKAKGASMFSSEDLVSEVELSDLLSSSSSVALFWGSEGLGLSTRFVWSSLP